MGDGKVNKYAIVINARSDAKGWEQTGAAVQDLRKKNYVTFAAGDKKHPVWSDMYVSSPANLKHMIAGIKAVVDDDDQVVVRVIRDRSKSSYLSTGVMKQLYSFKNVKVSDVWPPKATPAVVKACSLPVKRSSIMARQVAKMISTYEKGDLAARKETMRAIRKYILEHDIPTKISSKIVKHLIEVALGGPSHWMWSVDSNDYVRRRAYHAIHYDAVDMLMKYKTPRVVRVFIDALKDKNADRRGNAADALGHLKDRAAVPALVAAMLGRDSLAAQVALERINDPRTVRLVIRALKHPKPLIRLRAADLLGQRTFRSRDAVKPLIALLKDRSFVKKVSKDSSPWLAMTAAQSLGKIGDARAVRPLISSLKSKSDAFRRYVLSALGEFKNDKHAKRALMFRARWDRAASVRKVANYNVQAW